MSAILENVEGRHCGRTEAVNEESFQFAFGEMETYEGKGESL